MGYQALHSMYIPAWMRWWVIGCCGVDALLRLTVAVLTRTFNFSGGALWIIPMGATLIGMGMLLRHGDAVTHSVLAILLIPVLVVLVFSAMLWGFVEGHLLLLLPVLRPICILIAVWLAWSNAHTIRSGWASIIVGTIAIGISAYLTLRGIPW